MQCTGSFQKELCRILIWNYLKRIRKKKTCHPLITYSRAVCIDGGRTTMALEGSPGGCVRRGAGDHAHLVKCTFDEMHRLDSECRGGGGARREGLPGVSRLSLLRLVCLRKPSTGSLLAAEELAPGKGLAANNSKWWRRGGSLRCCSPL